MEKPRTARLLHKLLVLYQRVALYQSPHKCWNPWKIIIPLSFPSWMSSVRVRSSACSKILFRRAFQNLPCKSRRVLTFRLTLMTG